MITLVIWASSNMLQDSVFAKRQYEGLVQEFNKAYGHMLSFDELLLRPQWALKFCDTVRTAHGFIDVPDDIILRSVITRRKNPSS